MADNDITTKARKSHAPNGPRNPIEIGARFGKWEVIGPPQRTDTYGVYVWPCRCECGTEKTVSGASLRFGSSVRCKACAINEGPRRMPVDIIGRSFGGWKVVASIPVKERPDEDGNRAWLCQCRCGAEQALSLPQMKSNAIGCRRCSGKVNGAAIRMKPYESVYRHAKRTIVNRIGRKQVYDFTISYEQFFTICETGKCHYCWTPLKWARYSAGKRESGGLAYRLDRMDNLRGYVPGNVVAACKRCNYGKGAAYSYEEWFMMTKYFRH